MRSVQLGERIYEWIDSPEILSTDYYKISARNPLKLIEVITDELHGVILLGKVEAIVDTLIYNNEHGDIGTTVEFSGTNLVIFGLTLKNIGDSIITYNPPDEEKEFLFSEAKKIIAKLKSTIIDKKASINFDEDDEDLKYIIFGRRRFLLVGSETNVVLIHDKQIAVRKGESKLVLIDPVEGIIVAEKDKYLKIGGKGGYSGLGNLGVNIASSILDGLLWE